MSTQLHPPGATLLSFVLDLLGDAHSHGVRAHARNCRRCSQDIQRLRFQTAHVAFALKPILPPPLLRDALLQAAGEIHRLSPMAKNVARLLRMPHKQANALLTTLDMPRLWRAVERLWVLEHKTHAQGLFVRVPSSAQVDAHTVRQFLQRNAATTYRILVLQGCATDALGRSWRSGQLKMAKKFTLKAATGCDLILLFKPVDKAMATLCEKQSRSQSARAQSRLLPIKEREPKDLH